MADILAKLKDLIDKVIKFFKELIEKFTGKAEEPDETTGA